MSPTTVLLRLTLLLSFTRHLLSYATHRHLLHQPINLDNFQPSLSPQPDSHQLPKYPFSSLSSPPVINDHNQPFFPFYPSPPPPPPPPSSASLITFPANISSLIFPDSASKKPISRKLIAVVIAASLLAVVFVAAVAAVFLYHRRNLRTTDSNNSKFSRSDSVRLYPSNTPSSSDGPPPPPRDGGVSANSSTEFLYLGTLVNSRGVSGSVTPYRKLGSPELRPLPPLPRQNPYSSGEVNTNSCVVDNDGDEFFSPRGSYSIDNGNKVLKKPDESSSSDSGTRTDTDSLSSSLTNSPVSNSMPPICSNPGRSSQSNHFPEAPTRPAPPPPPPLFPSMSSGPPPFLTPTRRDEEISKPMLKPLHWDKVRPDSRRATVWDQLQSSSFQLNEEMMQTLFMVNASNLTPKDNARYSVLPMPNNDENRVLDPKKSQNIAILLRALNVTVDEVCQGLLDGNIETLGTEVLGSLLKMAPAKEEERKLKEFNDDSPFKLGPAEKFLKAVLDIPFAFERVGAMLYIANFDPEIECLQTSFRTLEIACEELKNNRIFLKLLEAVLKTGNRMNIGTNRGNAHAFKLDTLLKLVDVRGADGKTTLLHFVVQEIIKAEGSRISNKSTDIHDKEEKEFLQHGLQVVSGLIEELTSVKKAACMDFDVIRNEVSKLGSGIAIIKQVLVKVNEESISLMNKGKFCESGNAFLKRAEEKLVKIREHEKVVLCKVKEITVYFHGISTKEEAHPLRVFMVVSDFLSVLDQVCKEVAKINEQSTRLVTSTPQFTAPVFNNGELDFDSSDDDNSSSSS